MPTEYDQQLLESVAVRRHRMQAALLFGEQRTRRTAPDLLRRVATSVILTAVLCAGTVAYSFIADAIAQARLQDAQRSSSASPTASPSSTSASPTPTGYLARLVDPPVTASHPHLTRDPR